MLVYFCGIFLINATKNMKPSFSLGLHSLTLTNYFINPNCFRGFWEHPTLVLQIILEIKHVILEWPLRVANVHIWAKDYDSYSKFSKENYGVKIAKLSCSTFQNGVNFKLIQTIPLGNKSWIMMSLFICPDIIKHQCLACETYVSHVTELMTSPTVASCWIKFYARLYS